ncbi:MAG: uracil-DNA glycosylase family protein [Bacteroidia bacterium]
MNFAKNALDFFSSLDLEATLPDDVEVMNPFVVPETMDVNIQFYNKYYNDNNKRIFVLGINPGRFGAGVTGLCFTDPVRLEQELDIPSPFPKMTELSSRYVYEVIAAYGGVNKFYGNFYLGAVCPLGFVRNGRNLNYYDDKNLEKAVEPFIIETLWQQINLGAAREVCVCLGEGTNYKYFNKLNEKHKFFEQIIPLAHPRYIMQYKLRRKHFYVDAYMEVLKQCEKVL